MLSLGCSVSKNKLHSFYRNNVSQRQLCADGISCRSVTVNLDGLETNLQNTIRFHTFQNKACLHLCIARIAFQMHVHIVNCFMQSNGDMLYSTFFNDRYFSPYLHFSSLHSETKIVLWGECLVLGVYYTIDNKQSL